MRKIFKLFEIMRMGYLSTLLFKKVAAAIEHNAVLKSIQKCNHILDVGANKGQFSLVARKIFPEARIDSFEPISDVASIFNSIFKNDQNTFLYRMAIGQEQETVEMHISNKLDSSSILPIGKQQVSYFPGTEESYIKNVSVSPLRELIKPSDLKSPVFVKIDVQGYEIEVLKGCEDFFQYFSYIYIECSFIELYEGQSLADEVIDLLSNYFFKLDGVYNVFYDKNGVAIQGDFLFVKNK